MRKVLIIALLVLLGFYWLLDHSAPLPLNHDSFGLYNHDIHRIIGVVFIGEMVNTEIGHALWPDDPVSARLRRRLIDQGIFTDEQDVPELEHETGQYIARRVAAAVDLLGERGLMPMAQILAEQIESGINANPALISELAAGKTRITVDNSSTIILQALAQSAQRRAEQVYGIFFCQPCITYYGRTN